ncbi:MAG: hypothetical protein OHK0019_16440 [Saprospiraceae bacterium]
MTKILRHFYNLFRATMWLALAFARASFYFKTRALRDLALPHSESLTSREKRRLKHYFYGATYLSSVFCILRGHTRSRREKHLFTNLAALAYFFDDLVDAFRERDDASIFWQNNPEQYGQTADPRGLALHFLDNVYRELPPDNLTQFRDFMHRVFNVETSVISEASHQMLDLEKVTAEKGGYSVLLFRRVLANALSETEQEALFQFGYFVQLCDDIFDFWHDRQAGTTTLATFFIEKNDVPGLRTVFEGQVLSARKAFQNLPATANGDTGWAAVHFLVAITRVCLRHYEDLQKKHGTLPLDDRAAMVVDMEKWGNRLRAAKELLRAE